MSNFFKTAVKTFKTSGTLHPSSQWLVNKLLKNIDFSRDLTLIEFGTGDGVVTLEIAKRMNKNSQLLALEINPEFLALTEENLQGRENVQILDRSAFDIGEILEEKGIKEVDNFISSLPLSFFSDSETRPYLETCYSRLKAGNSYAQYQYTLGKYKLLRESFDSVNIDFTFRNIPPAFIYTCYKKANT